MKSLLFILLIYLPVSSQGQVLLGAQQVKMYVHAKNGLSLRKGPGKKFDKIKTLTYGTDVLITEHSDSSDTINGISGTWVKVNANDTIGFAFEPYLAEYKIPKNEDNYPYLKDFVYNSFELTEGDENFTVGEFDRLSKRAKFGDITYSLLGDQCDLNETLILPNSNMQKMMVVFTAWMDTYNVTKNIKDFNFDTYDKMYVHNFTKEEDPFWLNYFVSGDWSKKEGFTFYEVHFDWEGGGGSLSFQYMPDQKGVKIIHMYGCH